MQSTTSTHHPRTLKVAEAINNAVTILDSLLDDPDHDDGAADAVRGKLNKLEPRLHALLQDEFRAALPAAFGPWRLFDHSSYVVEGRELRYMGGLSIGDERAQFSGDKFSIVIQTHGRSLTPAQIYGMAHLIKAAPELLQALEDLAGQHTPEHVAAARTAIARARGQT